MKNTYWNIFILINFGCSEEITSDDNETFYAELNKNSENITMLGYGIAHFNDKNVEVRNYF